MFAQVFHHVPKPIEVSEFREAVQAICRPRFPLARSARPRRVGLAISGGVDSMALAYLFRRLWVLYPTIKIADNPLREAFSYIVDHQLRPGSDREASDVAQELRRIGVKPQILSMRWKVEKRQGLDPASLPNVESLARTNRYQALGSHCSFVHITSLFTAHHQDDQYETLLMRLLAGHGYRGLQGIREANEVPDCYDLANVYRSGLLDDQRSSNPNLVFRPTNKVLKELRFELRRQSRGVAAPLKLDWEALRHPQEFPGHLSREYDPSVPYLTPLRCEDGGITLYRPLLEFSKDRLRATCEANGIRWFEDHTNQDATLTLRNAVRHMVNNYELPAALQKPSILSLGKSARRRVQCEESEAARLITRHNVIKDFDSNVGTLLVEVPSFRAMAPKHRRLWAEAREEVRKPRRRVIAALAIRKLIQFVTPEHSLPAIANLDWAVDSLFPELGPAKEPPAPKAFTMAGVLFSPLVSEGKTKWFISRTPYPSSKDVPMRGLPWSSKLKPKATEHSETTVRHVTWRSWKSQKLWDGRFWVQLHTCVHYSFRVMPLSQEHLKPFRQALGTEERTRLERLLKYHAPGKVRYTLPAIYTRERRPEPEDGHTMTLLALPSLGVHLPGMERWIRYEIRYRYVDHALLGHNNERLKVFRVNRRLKRSQWRRDRRKELAKLRAALFAPEVPLEEVPVAGEEEELQSRQAMGSP